MKKTIFAIALLLGLTAVAQRKFTPDQKLSLTERIIENFYVDDIDTTKVVNEALRAMLKELDPHSSYTTPEETRQLTEPLQGNFSGIGIQFQLLNDTLMVVQTVAGGPSEKVGLMPGDRILEANDSLLSGVKRVNSDIQHILRGPKGTVVNVKVKRVGEPQSLEFRIVRDDIPVYSVDAAFMAAPEVGYIRLSRFGDETPKEMRKALEKLKKQGMKRLVIDLQNNGGGYLNAANEVAGLFLPKGAPIVATRGQRVTPNEYTNSANGPYQSLPLVVLVDQFSASASEILSGAIQDNDRGVVVGRRTYGKGLVQRPFPYPDGSMVRLTISRYYTPSGRCVQKPYTPGDEDAYTHDMEDRYNAGEFYHADSMHLEKLETFKTLHLGRTVYGGGGIIPDRFVPLDTTSTTPYYRKIMAKGIFNRLAATWIDNHRQELSKKYKNEDAFVRHFQTPDALMQQLINMGTEDGVEFNEEQYRRSEETMRTIMKALIGRDLFEQSTYFRVASALDPTYREGLEIISDPQLYNSYLQPRE